MLPRKGASSVLTTLKGGLSSFKVVEAAIRSADSDIHTLKNGLNTLADEESNIQKNIIIDGYDMSQLMASYNGYLKEFNGTEFDSILKSMKALNESLHEVTLDAKVAAIADISYHSVLAAVGTMHTYATMFSGKPGAKIGAIEKMMEITHSLLSSISRFKQTVANTEAIAKSLTTFSQALLDTGDALKALDASSSKILPFMKSFATGKYKSTKDTFRQIHAYFKAASKFKGLFPMDQLNFPDNEISNGVTNLCFNVIYPHTVDPVMAEQGVQSCLDVSAYLSQVMSKFRTVNSDAMYMLSTSTKIARGYLLVQQDQQVDQNYKKSLLNTEISLLNLFTAKAWLQVKLATLLMFSRSHLESYCALAAYYRGGEDVCASLKYVPAYINNDNMPNGSSGLSSAIEELISGISITPKKFSGACVTIPLTAPSKGSFSSNWIDVKALNATGKTTFTMGTDIHWLRDNHFDEITNILTKSPGNVFINQMTFRMPYALYDRRKSGCGDIRGFLSTITPDTIYPVADSNGKGHVFSIGPGSTSYSFGFEYLASRMSGCPSPATYLDSFPITKCLPKSDANSIQYTRSCVTSDGKIQSDILDGSLPPTPPLGSEYTLELTNWQCMNFTQYVTKRTQNPDSGTYRETYLPAEVCLSGNIVPHNYHEEMAMKDSEPVEHNTMRSAETTVDISSEACVPNRNICSPGEFVTVDPSFGCHQCPVGTHSPNGVSYGCELCDVGSFSPKEGATRCLKCSEADASNCFGGPCDCSEKGLVYPINYLPPLSEHYS